MTEYNTSESIKLAQVREFMSIVMNPSGGASAYSAILAKLSENGVDLQSLMSDHLLDPVWRELKERHHGLHLDWLDGPIMAQAVRWAVEGLPQVGLPIALHTRRYLGDPEEPEPFVWEKESVEEGLEAFARWLNVNRKAVSLLKFDTKSDSFFAIYCPTWVSDLAVEQLKMVGLSAPLIPGVDERKYMAMPVIEAIADVVVGDHGFAASSVRVGRFNKEVSDRYTLIIQVEKSLQGQGLDVTLRAADHEMNEIGRTVGLSASMVKWFPNAQLHTESVIEFEGSYGAPAQGIDESVTGMIEVLEKLTEKDIQSGLKKGTKGTLARRLMDKDWPKACDKRFLKQDGPRSASIRAYLDEHSIPYLDKR